MPSQVVQDWRRDLSASARDFQNIVWPILIELMGGGDLYPVETVTDSEIAKDLDILAGIDAWHIQKDRGRMRGIASRVQWTNNPFYSFTVRTGRPSGNKTELEKRLEQSTSDWLSSSLTVQAYLEKSKVGPLLLCFVVRTKHFYKALREHPKLLSCSIVNWDESSMFSPVWVSELKDYCKVWQYRPRDGWQLLK